MQKVRLSKLMSEQGMCSRREADRYIEAGWVSVDGQPVTELGTKIYPTQTIRLNREAHRDQLQQVTVLLNKPVGYVSGQPEPGYRPAIELIVANNQFCAQAPCRKFRREHLRHLAPAGRLDINSHGLLVFTQDGRIAKQLIGENSSVEKEYLVRVDGALSESNLMRLRHGLHLDGRALKPAQVEWINDDQLRFILREGRKRQIRRMCELVNLQVLSLKRVRIGNVRLGRLPQGRWRYLEDGETF
ncbi:MAG TPA: pseudouridine synthase [Burkholderiaceae bacterium]|nr:pseudouridine synthase [Burkholderiaceae bacterium]